MNKDIIIDNRLYASVHSFEDIEEGLNFLTDESSYIQVGTWSYEKNKLLEAHYHNYFERSSFRTQEVVIVIEGSIKCNIYTEEGKEVQSLTLQKGEFIIQFDGVHEYEILENTKVIEIKNGPYFGPEKDRTRINVRKN